MNIRNMKMPFLGKHTHTRTYTCIPNPPVSGGGGRVGQEAGLSLLYPLVFKGNIHTLPGHADVWGPFILEGTFDYIHF